MFSLVYQIFLPKKYSIFIIWRKTIIWKFFIDLKLYYYHTIIWIFFPYKILDFLLIFDFLIIFLMQGDIDTVKNFTIFVNPQVPFSSQRNSTKIFDPQESFQDLYICLNADGSTRYCVLNLEMRSNHWLSPSHFVVRIYNLVALLKKLFVSKVDWLWTFGSNRKQSMIYGCDNIIPIWSLKSLFLKTNDSTMYRMLYLSERRYHWLPPTHIVVWSCDLVALWQKLFVSKVD